MKTLLSISYDPLTIIHSLFFRNIWYKVYLLYLIKLPMCHFRIKIPLSAPPTAHSWLRKPAERVWACQQQQETLVETDLYSAMALLTLHRLPSISTAPVSPVTPCCTRSWEFCIISSDMKLFRLHFALQRVIQNYMSCLCWTLQVLHVEQFFLDVSLGLSW